MIKSRSLIIVCMFFYCCQSSNSEEIKIDDFTDFKSLEVEREIISFDEELIDYFEVDRDGNLFVIKNQDERIYKYLSDGTPFATAGRTGRGPNEFEEGSIVKMSLQDSTLIGYSVNDSRIKEYDLNLNYLNEIVYNGVLLSVEILNNNLYLSSNMSVGLNLSNDLRLFDPHTNRIREEISLLKHKNINYRLLFEITVIDSSHFAVSYFAINKNQIFNTNGQLINTFTINSLGNQSVEKEHFGRVIPESLIIRDVAYDQSAEKFLFIEGGSEAFSGSNILHSHLLSGEYNVSFRLPVSVEQIIIQNGILYGLTRSTTESSIISFGSIEW